MRPSQSPRKSKDGAPAPADAAQGRQYAVSLLARRDHSRHELRAKLIESGWLLEPYGEEEMRCQECMYYLVHKRWCDLPELDLPAEPDWWCRLWRI